MALDGRASQRLRCTRSPCTDGKTPQIESRICASAIRKFQMQGTALSPRQTQIWTAHGRCFEKSGQNAAQRRKGGVGPGAYIKNSFPKKYVIVFVLPVSLPCIPAACGV